jgi:hypothetical protein
MLHVLRIGAMSAALWLAACSRVCPEAVPLLSADGGARSCVLATDCPRPSNVLVCSNSEDELRDCVGCVDTNCVRFRPLSCP